tara:strand:- start:120 stop:269 length:150 start_codon:yes stop_codon:yes gene_type:complete
MSINYLPINLGFLRITIDIRSIRKGIAPLANNGLIWDEDPKASNKFEVK